MTQAAIYDRYKTFEWPAYKFREYPKKVTASNGQRVTVHNSVEEENLLNASETKVDGLISKLKEKTVQDKQRLSSSNDRKVLVATAQEFGIIPKSTWSIEVLKAEIGKAEAARDALTSGVPEDLQGK
jgi:hypothetical protein